MDMVSFIQWLCSSIFPTFRQEKAVSTIIKIDGLSGIMSAMAAVTSSGDLIHLKKHNRISLLVRMLLNGRRIITQNLKKQDAKKHGK